MIITVASYKGGVGKTTTAMHLAGFLNKRAPTLLLDGDPTRNATSWARRCKGELGFPVVHVDLGPKMARCYEHVVIDTGQKPSAGDLQAAAEGCDLLVIPGIPSALDTDGLGQTIRALQDIGCTSYRVLLTRVPADGLKEVVELRDLLDELTVPMFDAQIPRLKVFEKAASRGVLAYDVDDKQAERAWACYCAVGSEMTR